MGECWVSPAQTPGALQPGRISAAYLLQQESNWPLQAHQHKSYEMGFHCLTVNATNPYGLRNPSVARCCSAAGVQVQWVILKANTA